MATETLTPPKVRVKVTSRPGNLGSDRKGDTHVPSSTPKGKADAAAVSAAAKMEHEVRERKAIELLSGVRSRFDDFLNYGQKSFEEVLAIGERLNELKGLVKQGLPSVQCC